MRKGKKLKRKILAWILVFVMMPLKGQTTAYADGDNVTNTHISHETATAWEQAVALPTTSGSYYLTTDVTISITQTITEGNDVNLCLNGHVIKSNSSENCIIKIESGATLNIYECQETEHKFKTSKDSAWTLDEQSGDRTIKGGVITGGQSSFGSAISNFGTLVVCGGNIVGNTSNYSSGMQVGGAIYNSKNATAYIYNNVNVIGNYGKAHGGTVFNLGTFYNYGNISENVAFFSTIRNCSGEFYNGTSTNHNDAAINNNITLSTSEGSVAGGVANYSQKYDNPAKFYNYGQINGNESKRGAGGVINKAGEFTNYGTINNNIAARHCGGVDNTSTDAFSNEYEGTYFANYGQINGNIATGTQNGGNGSGGGVYNEGNAKFYNYSEICNNKARTSGGGFLISASNCPLYVGKDSKITGNEVGTFGADNQFTDGKTSNICLNASDSSKILFLSDDKLTDKAQMGVHITKDRNVDGIASDEFSNGGVDNYVERYFFADNDKQIVMTDRKEVYLLTNHTHNWTYVVDRNAIKAYCTVEDPKCSYYGTADSHENALKVTLTAEDKDYSGAAYDGASVIDDGISVVTKATVEDITYYLADGSTKTGTSADQSSGATSEGGAPKNAGTYIAKVNVIKDEHIYTVQKEFQIKPTDLESPTISGVEDGKTYCEAKIITVTDSYLDKVFVNGTEVTLTNNTYTLAADGTTYVIKATDKAGNSTTVTVTVNATHSYSEWMTATAPTCTEKGLRKKTCVNCGAEVTEELSTLGHDWSGQWVVTKEATATKTGKKELTCRRTGCNHKRYEAIPVIGTPEDPNEGKLQKDAEVAPNAPIEEATLDNTKTELLNALAIFTATEKQAIENGADARVWMEVSKTDESSIPSADKTKISDAATSIMGENPSITYFDADLFKQVGAGTATQLHEPGIDIEVTIKVPETLRNADSSFEREYKIIRLHTDVATGASLVDILSGTFDKVTGEFTFKTDKFSTYAIAYTDKKLVTGVTLTPETATLTQVGQSVQLTATVAPADATDKSVTWASSNTNVATVDANGKVTAVANGTAVITVTTTDGNKTAQSTITVAIATTQTPSDNTTPSSSATTKNAVSNRIRLNGGMKFSQTGKQLNLSWGKVSVADGYDVYVQYCGKLFNAKSVTTIKNAKTNKIVIKKINGKSIDPKKVYKAYVVAYKMSNGKKVTLAKSITVHVVGSRHATETNVKSIKLTKSSYTLKKGKTAQIKAKSVLVDSKKKRISDNHGKEFRYTTSNAKVATVTKDGKIKWTYVKTLDTKS